MTFRIPKQKIIATHFFASGWAPDFWSALDLQQVDAQLTQLKTLGFNCVIIVVPWCGFTCWQASQGRHVSNTKYWQLLQHLLTRLEQHELNVILRIGYSHDSLSQGDPATFSSTRTATECFMRHMTVTTNKQHAALWHAFLSQLWTTVKTFPNVLGGFLSWEDFLLLDIPPRPLAERLKYAQLTGFQTYLAAHYSLTTVSSHYDTAFSDWHSVPIPAVNSPALKLLGEFWDVWLVEQIFKPAVAEFPALTMEVRIDCEPLPNGESLCHTRTFDLSPATPITFIYYLPAWGSAASGQQDSAANAVQRLKALLHFVREHTDNAIFIDQFNFIDNTPGFEQNAQIASSELIAFLQQATPLLHDYTVGYGLWSLQDVAANAILNHRLAAQWGQWHLQHASYVIAEGSCGVQLETNGHVQQQVANLALTLCGNQPCQLTFQAKLLQSGHTTLRIAVVDRNQSVTMSQCVPLTTTQWQWIQLHNIPFRPYDTLRIANTETPVMVTAVYLYQLHQENGMISANGTAKPFMPAVVALNAALKDTNNNKEDI